MAKSGHKGRAGKDKTSSVLFPDSRQEEKKGIGSLRSMHHPSYTGHRSQTPSVTTSFPKALVCRLLARTRCCTLALREGHSIHLASEFWRQGRLCLRTPLQANHWGTPKAASFKCTPDSGAPAAAPGCEPAALALGPCDPACPVVLDTPVAEQDAVWSLWQVLMENCSTCPEVLEQGHALADRELHLKISYWYAIGP